MEHSLHGLLTALQTTMQIMILLPDIELGCGNITTNNTPHPNHTTPHSYKSVFHNVNTHAIEGTANHNLALETV
ncbi:hypothetical protein [Zymobacter sp. IVIA_5232.4 C2]|uniref:hypothetical protein n=1 Tax=Zymobacter sp. IVIA_5232.4 C2 TaxID=3394855 RepID=UPI0039C3A9B8